MARKLTLALAVVVVVATAGYSIAFGHSRPIRFSVAPGSVIDSAPSQITGWFAAELRQDPNWTFIHVTDTQGNRVDTGTETLSSDRLQMTVNLRAGLAAGRYLVSWRTFDDGDGAIFGDCFIFFVGQAAADQAVKDKTHLDGGTSCQRIDVSARDGTPVSGATPAATAADGDDDIAHSEGSGGDSGVPVWALIAGIGVGVVVGGVGGRILGSRP